MDLATFRQLLTPAGCAALSSAVALAPTEAGFLACFERLRKAYPDELAKAALDVVLLRVRARDKFEHADQMFFTREALEQSSGDATARHRAARFAPFGVVADLCAGIGGDALSLAAAGLMVHGVECDPLRAAMLVANADALGLAARVRVHEGDALSVALPGVRAAFADPTRRMEGRRYLDPEDYTPPLSAIRGRFPADSPLAVKVAPGVAHADLAGLEAEIEFVSVAGELKECVLWFGPLRTAARRATVLPSGLTQFADHPPPLPPVAPVGAFVYDPNPAVVRAGLAGLVAAELGLSPIDPTVAVLTGDTEVCSPLARGYRVALAERVDATRLRAYFRDRDVGRVTVIKRGSSIDADELQRKLRLSGKGHRVVLLTRANGVQTMIVGEKLPSNPGP
jgi:hypothetical protein